MAINERLVHTASASAAAGTGNQEEGLMLHLDANDVDSYDGDGDVWYDIHDHEYTPATNVSEHFNTVIWSGDGNADRDITGVGFTPDLVWIKNRDTTDSHQLFDSLRDNYGLYSNGTAEQFLIADWDIIDDGFDLGAANNGRNGNGNDIVAWCFKAGGAPSGSDKVSIDGTSYSTMAAAGLTDGTEPISKLSVNTKLGFSIVKYTAPALAVDTVAHGLGETPEMIILKSTSVARNWNVFHKDVGTSKNLHLNTTDAANTSEYWTANSNTFSIQDYSASADWIAYAFASKRGVSKVGSYTGTGVAGNKVYTGFEPAFVMMKRTSSAGAGWYIVDNKRDTNNNKDKYFSADSNHAELTSGSSITFNRDGFTFNGNSYNTSAQTHIYYAVAKDTNETSLIPDTDLELHLDPTSYSGSGTTWTADAGNNGTVVASTYDEELGDSFDLTSNTITLPIDAGPLNGTSFTFETWLWQDSNSGTQYFFSDTGISLFTISGTQMRFIKGFSGTNNDDGYFNPTVNGSGWATNKWNHVAVTFSSTTSKVYINGVLVNTHTEGSGTGTAISTYQISHSAGRWKGKIGQYRVYSSALSQDQIRQNFNFTKNDYPNGINADRTNTPTWNPSGYWDFDGGTSNCDSFFLPQSLTLNPWFTNTHTVSMWINFDSFASYPTFWATYDYAGASYGTILRADNDGRIRQSAYFNNSSTNQFSSALNTGQWYHIVGSFSQGDCRLYIDKVHIGTNTATFNYPSGGGRPAIGALRHTNATTTDNGHDGKISKFKLYDKFLTTDEIQALYDEGY